jgi:hypothetical protein
MDKRNSHRGQKRWLNYLRRTCGYGKFVEACDYHPSIVTKLHYDTHQTIDRKWDGSIDVKSLIDGHESCCSLTHCGISPMSKAEASKRMEYAKKFGVDAMIDCLYVKSDLEGPYDIEGPGVPDEF